MTYEWSYRLRFQVDYMLFNFLLRYQIGHGHGHRPKAWARARIPCGNDRAVVWPSQSQFVGCDAFAVNNPFAVVHVHLTHRDGIPLLDDPPLGDHLPFLEGT